MKSRVPIDTNEKRIVLINNQKVLLDRDLAEPYGVETKMIIHSVKRNPDRFPADIMIQL